MKNKLDEENECDDEGEGRGGVGGSKGVWASWLRKKGTHREERSADDIDMRLFKEKTISCNSLQPLCETKEPLWRTDP